MGPSPITTLSAALAGVARIGFDAAPIIYFVEFHPIFGYLAREVFQRLDRGEFVGYSSVLTLTEVLPHPKRVGDRRQEQAYRTLLSESEFFHTILVSEQIADRAADLRARYNLRTPDAIHLATALEAGCQAFLTNDLTLRRVTELRVLVLGTLTH